MRLQLATPSEHRAVLSLPWTHRLDTWTNPTMRDPGGPHRHVVRILEIGQITYVLKELPDDLVEREYRLLRDLAEAGLPTVEVIGAATERAGCDGEGILITRHLDFSLPYRVLLSGRGLTIPFLGERVLDALVGLLVRLHLQGFFWGDCSLSNTLFRRDAGALVAFIIDVETGELHPRLSDGQRRYDIDLAVENVAGGLLDLQAAGHLALGIDPVGTAAAIEQRYLRLWDELTGSVEITPDETFRVDERLERLHALGFDVAEVEVVTSEAGERLRIVPRVVELGYHAPRLASLTGLRTGENQARRLLNDIARYGAELECTTGRRLPETVVAARWLDRVYEPTVAQVGPGLADRLEPAEAFHQLLEHRWFLSERAGKDVGLDVALRSYRDTVLAGAPDEHVVVDPPTVELPIVTGPKPDLAG